MSEGGLPTYFFSMYFRLGASLEVNSPSLFDSQGKDTYAAQRRQVPQSVQSRCLEQAELLHLWRSGHFH